MLLLLWCVRVFVCVLFEKWHWIWSSARKIQQQQLTTCISSEQKYRSVHATNINCSLKIRWISIFALTRVHFLFLVRNSVCVCVSIKLRADMYLMKYFSFCCGWLLLLLRIDFIIIFVVCYLLYGYISRLFMLVVVLFCASHYSLDFVSFCYCYIEQKN